jgi:type I site-specific restriction-modification system R (restriction) subunit
MSRLEVHHIFPKAQLYKRDFKRPEVNALANFCFLTKDTNLDISDRLPEVYFPEVEQAHPGALASQWIPDDPELWKNKAVYSLLRYGVPVKTEAGKVTETVRLIDWEHPENNDFAIAEEVTLRGNHERRPDLVLYVNGIAVGVIELKNSRVSIGDGIRQNLSNQQPEFNEWFFSTCSSSSPATIPRA